MSVSEFRSRTEAEVPNGTNASVADTPGEDIKGRVYSDVGTTVPESDHREVPVPLTGSVDSARTADSGAVDIARDEKVPILGDDTSRAHAGTVFKFSGLPPAEQVREVRTPGDDPGKEIEEPAARPSKTLTIDPGFADSIAQQRKYEGRAIITGDRGEPKDFFDRPGLFYGSEVESYDSTFEPVLEGKTIMDLIKEKEVPVVLDLMAPADTIFDIFTRLPRETRQGEQRRGIAVTLLGPDEQDAEIFAKFGITQLPGDLTHAKTWNNIDTERGGRQFTHIFERAYGGLWLLPTHPQFYRYSFMRSWNMLDDHEGHLLWQLPGPDKVPFNFTGWKLAMRDSGFTVVGDPYDTHNVLHLLKREDSPKEIPQLR